MVKSPVKFLLINCKRVKAVENCRETLVHTVNVSGVHNAYPLTKPGVASLLIPQGVYALNTGKHVVSGLVQI